MIIPVRVSSMGQTELFHHFLYFKLFNCMQTNELWLISKCYWQIIHLQIILFNMYIYKMDLALSNLQGLYQKTQPTYQTYLHYLQIINTASLLFIPIPVSFLLFEAPIKVLFWYGVKLHHHMTFNVLNFLKTLIFFKTLIPVNFPSSETPPLIWCEVVPIYSF